MNTSAETISADRKIIKDNTQILLSSENYGEIYAAVHALHDVLSAITGIRAGDISDKDILLPQGKAVSPIKAAFCLLEFERTRRFLRGIYKAILHLKEKVKGRPVNILYAGCGPYATLVTPLTSVFNADELRFSLLDINEVSLDAARRLYESLTLSEYVKEYILADGTTYQLNPGDQIDMIVSETMHNALKDEPMVAIMDNLMPQLGADGIFIPQQITVDAALLNATEEQAGFLTAGYQPKRIALGNVYTIGTPNGNRAAITFTLPPAESHPLLRLLTRITVFGDEVLTDYNCSLNLPAHIATIPQPVNFNAVKFEYEQGAKPGYRVEFLSL